MFKHYFESIENVERGPVISLVIFFLFFLCLLVYIWKMDKGYIKKMKNMPMEGDEAATAEIKEIET